MLLTEGQKTLRFYHTGFGTGYTDFNWGATLTAKTWYHIAVTFNGTKAAIYIDGVEVASQTDTAGSVVPNNNSLMIGANRTAGGDPYPLQGTLDEVRLWNVARTVTQLNDYMSYELEGNETGLVLNFDMNQGIGSGNNTGITTVTDKSSAGNNGVLNQFRLTGATSNFIHDTSNNITPKLNQIITFNPLANKVYGDADFNVVATSNSGLAITYSSSDPSVATVSGNTITVVGLGTTTITASQAGSIVYNSASASQTLTVNADVNQSIWNGNTSSVWNETTNWSGNAVPTTTQNVVIPNVATTPNIASGVVATMHNLAVETSSAIAISEDGAAVIENNFDNNGTVIITSTADKSGAFIIKGIANGQVTYERGGLVANKWSVISASVAGQSVKDFVENVANNIRINTSTSPNRYAVGYYDDSRATGDKWVYYTVDDLASNTITFVKGKSYAISRGTNGAVSFTGTVETTNVNKSIAASEWNAVGNPFTAFLPINENGGSNFVNDNLLSFDPAYVGAYVWDNSQNKYVAKTLVGAESSLAPGQGFFVKATASASSITFNEAQRKAQPISGGTFSRGVAKATPTIKLSIGSKDVKVQTTITYRDQATKGLDAGYDVGNFDGASLDIYTHLLDGSSEKSFTYQSLPKEGLGAFIIPVGVKAKEGASITISAKTMFLPAGMKVYLEDKEQGEFIDLSEENYTLTLSKSVNGIGRFYLHTKAIVEVPEVAIHDIKIYNIAQQLLVKGIYEEYFEITMYNTLGALVYKEKFQGVGENNIILPTVETGIYIVRLKTKAGTKSKKITLKK